MDAPIRFDERPRLVVALDGPASSGKSSVGAAAARRLGYRFCDTGLLYRALTWLALRNTVATDNGAVLATLVEHVQLASGPDGQLNHVVADAQDVTTQVHSPQVDEHVSAVARQPEVRAALLERQRQIAAAGAIIVAGRDIGSVVLPDADLKLYLDASVTERARRRTVQAGHAPGGVAAAHILAEVERRDAQDSSRILAPLRIPDDALIVVTDEATFEETVDMVEAAILDAEAARAGGGAA